MPCSTCGGNFEGHRHAWCPPCLAARWGATPNLIREKHDPDATAAAQARYRSILTPRLKAELKEVLCDAAARGRWFWDRDYGMWVHVTDRPLGRSPGVGIPAGGREAEHALDCLFIAEADSPVEAHAFAADPDRHAAQVRAGVFEPLGECGAQGCSNLQRPGRGRCDTHA